jgi:hypothetical protein
MVHVDEGRSSMAGIQKENDQGHDDDGRFGSFENGPSSEVINSAFASHHPTTQ